MTVLSLGNSFWKTEGKDSNPSSANEAGKRLSYHLDKCNEHWARLNFSHVDEFTYPTLLLVDSKYERSLHYFNKSMLNPQKSVIE